MKGNMRTAKITRRLEQPKTLERWQDVRGKKKNPTRLSLSF
jgi:hypothetical protein